MNRRAVLKTMATSVALATSGIALPALGATASIRFRDLYIKGRELTPETAALAGQIVQMTGYMAPPLKPEVDFFVLTKLPMATCPFCNDAADWPTDLVVAYSAAPIEVVRFSDLIRVEGRFETGFWTDPNTGFVSFLRLQDVTYTRL